MLHVQRDSLLRKPSFQALALVFVLMSAWLWRSLRHVDNPASSLSLTGAYAGKSWIPFDAQRWRDAGAHHGGDLSTRYLMVPDLLEHHCRVGMPAKDAAALFGETWWPGRQALVYDIGPDDQRLMPGWLVLEIDLGREVVRHIELTTSPD